MEKYGSPYPVPWKSMLSEVWVTTHRIQAPIKAYERSFFLCGCVCVFFLVLVFWTQKHSGPSFLLWYVLYCSRSTFPPRLHISPNGRRTQTRLSWLTDSFSSHQQWLAAGDRAASMDIAPHKLESFLSFLLALYVCSFFYLSRECCCCQTLSDVRVNLHWPLFG